MSKKFEGVFISFGNMMIIDRKGFREVLIVKARLKQIKEIVKDKDKDPVSVDQFFKIYCEGEQRNMTVVEVEFRSREGKLWATAVYLYAVGMIWIKGNNCDAGDGETTETNT